MPIFLKICRTEVNIYLFIYLSISAAKKSRAGNHAYQQQKVIAIKSKPLPTSVPIYTPIPTTGAADNGGKLSNLSTIYLST